MWKPDRLYSQNFEDLYISQVFSKKTSGTYIDVGAFHPTIDSVTKIFYDTGWSGINIEPHPDLIQLLIDERPRDININVALTSPEKALHGTAMLLSKSSRALDDGCHCLVASEPDPSTNKIIHEVKLSILHDVIISSEIESVDFLKIDVEGSEFDVLQGLELPILPLHLHPKLVLVETVLPSTTIYVPQRTLINKLLSSHDYRHIFFDGLNDYYLKSELYLSGELQLRPPSINSTPPLSASKYFNALDHNSRLIESRLATNEKLRHLDQDLTSQKILNQDLADHNNELKSSIASLEAEQALLKETWQDALNASRENTRKKTEQLNSLHEDILNAYLTDHAEELGALSGKLNEQLAINKDLKHETSRLNARILELQSTNTDLIDNSILYQNRIQYLQSQLKKYVSGAAQASRVTSSYRDLLQRSQIVITKLIQARIAALNKG